MKRVAMRHLSAQMLILAVCTAGVLTFAAPAAATLSPATSSPAHAIVMAVDDPAAPEPLPPGALNPAEVSTPEPVPTVSPTPTLTPTPSPTQTPTPTETVIPSPVPTPTPVPSETPVEQDTGEVTPLPAVPPSFATSNVSLTTLVIAISVLAASLIVLWLMLRRRPNAASSASAAVPATTSATAAAVVLDSMANTGAAMIDSGYPVSMVRSAVKDIAAANGYPSAEVVVFPTALFVSLNDESATLTRAVSAGRRSYLLHQVDVIDRVVKVGRLRAGSSAWVTRQLAKVGGLAAPFTSGPRVFGYALTSGAIAVLLGASWLGILVAAILGAGVGTLLLLGERLAPSYNALVIVGAALGSSVIVLLVARAASDPGVLPSLVAPLVILLPGGLLTTAVIELATGHIMSGSARAAAGAMRLLLLAVGILSAGALVGVPRVELDVASEPLGPLAPWIAVALFGVGITIYQCARPASIPWILLVLYVAYGAQVIGDVLFGGVLSALIGAIAMTPVAVVVARHRNGPPAIVSFLPAFWILVPGALGLVGVTEVLGGDSGAGATLVTTLGTMIAIALGVLIGLAASSSLRDRRLPKLFDFLEPLPVPVSEPRRDPGPDGVG
ncbi:Rhs element Vgr protein [Leifsonia rubra CMS 76R]|nr:Rhs element Vgr protein [Leifsonia rubra CMS 76R]